MADISKITLPSGNSYDIKDAVARAQIGGAIKIKGTTTTALTDEATTNPIKINSADYTAVANDAVFYNKKEFVFDGTKWHEFGDMSGLGSLATKNSASGTVSVPKSASFTGTAKNVSVSGTTTGSVSVTKSTVTVSKATSGTATYTPAGSNAASSVSGSCAVTPSGTISEGTGTANYTPKGSVAAPTISVKTAGSTTSVTPFGSAGTLPSATMPTYTVANETLTITAGSFSAGTLPSAGTAVTVKTGDAAYQATAPTFTGTGAELKFTGSSSSGTISGTAAAQTFTGQGARLVTDSEVATGASFTGASMTSTGSYTPEGTVTLTNENKTVTVS